MPLPRAILTPPVLVGFTLAWICASVLFADSAAAEKGPRTYRVDYRIEPQAGTGLIDVMISIGGAVSDLPSRIALAIDPKRHSGFEGDGEVDTTEVDRVVWTLPGAGGELRYRFRVDRKRGAERFDARMTDDWAVFRADHMVPALSSKGPPGRESRSRMVFVLPDGWSAYTAYGKPKSGRVEFADPERRFDRPKGWMILGRVGSRADTVAGIEVRVAAPAGTSTRRQDTLAFLAWTLPELTDVFRDTPEHLLVVRVPAPFWRGGLSGPSSLYLHEDRPLISENRTSTMIHELVHVLSGIHGDDESDWIAEGLAEYYSVEMLRRTHAISEDRFHETIDELIEWGASAPSLLVPRSSGAVTARAVGVFVQADREIRDATGDLAGLDDVVRELTELDERVGLADLQRIAKRVARRPVEAFARANLIESVPATSPPTEESIGEPARLPAEQPAAKAEARPTEG